MSTPVVRDLPPFVKAFGSPARIHGLNTVGMSRLGAGPDLVAALAEAYQAGDHALFNVELDDWPEKLAEGLHRWRALETAAWTRWVTE